VARPRIEDGGQQHFILQIGNRKSIGGFKRLQRIGQNPSTNDNLVGCAHKSGRPRKDTKQNFGGRSSTTPQLYLMPLQIFRFKAGVFGDAREHLRTDFFAVMEGKHHIRPAVPRQNSMGTMGSAALAFDGPTDAEQSGENPARFV
jgi:hypothetical protein